MKIALAQINPTVATSPEIRRRFSISQPRREQGADLVIFPELCVCGYPPADLLEKTSFLARAAGGAGADCRDDRGSGPAILCGTALAAGGGRPSEGKQARNVAALLSGGKVSFLQQKMLLPFYDVFDEQRYFEPASGNR